MELTLADNLRQLIAATREGFAKEDVVITGVRYCIVSPHQRKKRGMKILFLVSTHNLNFFGNPYENARRIKLLDLCYEVAYGKAADLFPEYHVLLDAYVRLEGQHQIAPPVFHSSLSIADYNHGQVDVTQDNNVELIPIQQLRDSNEVQPGSSFDIYCNRYDLQHVLKHQGHYISPDIVTVEVLEAIFDAYPGRIKSVLEIGAGVGICGEAARRRGIEKFTFVDTSSVVCNYLRRETYYSVIQADAFSVPLHEQWDVILCGIPYELNARLIQERGREFSRKCDFIVFQSGSPSFFEFEHDLISGNARTSQWPWWKKEQTLPFHFPATQEVRFDWQLGLIGTRTIQLMEGLQSSLRARKVSRFLEEVRCEV